MTKIKTQALFQDFVTKITTQALFQDFVTKIKTQALFQDSVTKIKTQALFQDMLDTGMGTRKEKKILKSRYKATIVGGSGGLRPPRS